MTIPLNLGVLIGSLPAGYAVAFTARNLADSPRIPTVAMIGAYAFLAIWAALVMPTIPLLAVSCVLGWILLVLASVDVLAFRLPDILTLPLIASGLALAWWLPDHDFVGHLVATLTAMAIFYAVAAAYRRVRHQDGLGLGDVKLAGAAGAWLNWQALPYVVLLACALGFVWVGVAMARRGRESLKERIPFGVALCVAIWIVWLYGPPEFFGALS